MRQRTNQKQITERLSLLIEHLNKFPNQTTLIHEALTTRTFDNTPHIFENTLQNTLQISKQLKKQLNQNHNNQTAATKYWKTIAKTTENLSLLNRLNNDKTKMNATTIESLYIHLKTQIAADHLNTTQTPPKPYQRS